MQNSAANLFRARRFFTQPLSCSSPIARFGQHVKIVQLTIGDPSSRCFARNADVTTLFVPSGTTTATTLPGCVASSQKKPDNAVVVKANWRDNPWFPAVLEEERRLDLQLYPERYAESKRLGVLHELVPHATEIAVLMNPRQPVASDQANEVKEAARALGLDVHIVHAASESDLEPAFATCAQLRAGGLLVTSDPFFNVVNKQIIALAARNAIPAIYEFREYVAIGGLASCGSSPTDRGVPPNRRLCRTDSQGRKT